jgi:hypothetical protein
VNLTVLDTNEVTCLETQFRPFVGTLQAAYAEACDDAKISPDHISFEFATDPWNAGGPRAEFVALEDNCRLSVRVTWAGFASLWCFAQAYSRIAKRFLNATREAKASCKTGPIELEVTAEIETARRLFDFALTLRQAEPEKWPTDLPLPDATATSDDDRRGNKRFLGALGWIYRHELAHHVLKHLTIQPPPEKRKNQELEADNQATKWLKGELKADRTRLENSTPDVSEIELEKRALDILIGLAWLAHTETEPHGRSATHPDAPTRIRKVHEQLELACDSTALETFFYFV